MAPSIAEAVWGALSRTRGWLALCALSLTVVFLAAFAASSTLGRELLLLHEFHETNLYTALRLQSLFNGAVEESFAYIVSGDEREREYFQEKLASFSELADRYAEQIREEEARLLADIRSGEHALAGKAQAVLFEYRDAGRVTPETFRQYEDSVDAMAGTLEALVGFERSEVHQANRSATAAIRRAQGFIWSIAGVSVLLLFFFVVAALAIVRLRTRARELDGLRQDLAVRVDERNREIQQKDQQLLQ